MRVFKLVAALAVLFLALVLNVLAALAFNGFKYVVSAFRNRLGFKKQHNAFDDSETAQKMLPEKMKVLSTDLPQEYTSEERILQVFKLPLKEVWKNCTERIAKFCVDKDLPPHTIGLPERVLLIVGATGEEKSILINGMANYILGIKWNDSYRFKLITNEGNRLQASSQTKWITAYTFPRRNGSPVPYNLTIINTPGFVGTEDFKQITAQMKSFFEKCLVDGGLDTIHSICIVAKGSEAQLTKTQKYVCDSILRKFGKVIQDNIFLISFVDEHSPPVLDAFKAAKIPVQPTWFKFNSETGTMNFKDFFNHFEKAKAINLQQIRDVLKEGEQLRAFVQSLQLQVINGINKVNSLHKEKEILEQHKDEIEANKDFDYEVKEERMKLEKLDESICSRMYATNCLVCNFTCHRASEVPIGEDKESCSAMDDSGYCTVCPNKCHRDQHRNDDFYYEQVTLPVRKTYREMQRKYHGAHGKKTLVEYVNVIEGIEKRLRNERKEVFTTIVQVHQSLQWFDEIALKTNPLTLVEYIDLLIESEKQQATKDWKKRVRYLEEAQQQAVIITGLTGQDSLSDDDLQMGALLDIDSIRMFIAAEEKHQKEGWELRVELFKKIEQRLLKTESQGDESTKSMIKEEAEQNSNPLRKRTRDDSEQVVGSKSDKRAAGVNTKNNESDGVTLFIIIIIIMIVFIFFLLHY